MCPRIESELEGASEPLRMVLFLELLDIELHYRIRHGEAPVLTDYEIRFPEYSPFIQWALSKATTALASSTQGSTISYHTGQHASSSQEYQFLVQQAAVFEEEPDLPVVPDHDVEEVIGRGGMGVVYRARDRRLKRRVALKMIRADRVMHAEGVRLFQLEAQSVARIQHPNILQIYEIGDTDGLPFVTLELLEGGSLAERLAGRR